ncbi:hypothetical protein WJX82_011263 [Trebouxia sp. C0006]
MTWKRSQRGCAEPSKVLSRCSCWLLTRLGTRKRAGIEEFQELSAESRVRRRQQGTRRGGRVEVLSGRG